MRPKDPLPTMDKSAVIYRIDCGDCPSNYVGETAKRVGTRVHEHKLAVKRGEQYSQIATHMTETGHRFDFEKVQVLASDNTKGGRLLKEAWLSNKDSINRHIDLCPAHLTLRTWSMSNLPPHRRQHKGIPNRPMERITGKSPPAPPPPICRHPDGIQIMSEAFPPIPEQFNTPEHLRGALRDRGMSAWALGAGTPPPRYREGRELSNERLGSGTPSMRILNSPPHLREKRTASPILLPTTTRPPYLAAPATTRMRQPKMRNSPDRDARRRGAESKGERTMRADPLDCQMGNAQDDPAKAEMEHIGTGDGGKRRLGATTTRLYSKRGETASLTGSADTTHPSYPANPQDHNMQIRSKQEIRGATATKSNSTCRDQDCGKGKGKENKRQRTVTRQLEWSGGGGDRLTQSNETGAATRQKGRGNIPTSPEPSGEETSDTIHMSRRCKKAIITNKKPATGKQPDLSGPMTRSRSRVQTLTNL